MAFEDWAQWWQDSPLDLSPEDETQYGEWLSEQIGDISPERISDRMSMLSLSPSSTVKAGWRHVPRENIENKVRILFQEQKWDACGIQVYLSEGMQPSQRFSYCYVRGHQRTVSLHALLRYFWSHKLPLPQWVSEMSCEVPSKIMKETCSSDAGLNGIAQAVQQRRGTSGWGYITICLFMQSHGWTLQVFTEKVATWLAEALDTRMYEKVISRVSPKVIQMLSAWQDKHCGSNDIIPLSFWQQTKYLLPAPQRKGVASCFSSEDEQVLFMERFLHHLTKKASDGVVGHGLAASVPEKMRETFRNVACRFAEIRPKLKMAHDLQPAEVEKVEAAFRSGELDGWLNSEATEDFSSWPVVQAICHARETTLRAEKRSAALQELMELEAKENLMDLSEATTGAADGPGMDAGLISEQKQRATSLLDWLRAREDSQKLIAKLYRDVAESEQHKVEEAQEQCREKFELIRGHIALPPKCNAKSTVVLMHSPWVKSEALVKEVCKHQDAALIVLLPCDPQQSVAGEMKIVKEIETAGLEVGQARRLTCMLKCQKDEAVAIQHLLVVTAKELPMRPLRTRIFQSSAFRETWLKETCGYEPGPRGENGHPIWTGGAVSRSFLKSLFTKLDCWPLVDEYILETDPHWDFLMEVQGCQGGWVGLHSHAAAAKVKVLQRCLESVPKSMAQQESDPGNDHLKDLFSNAIAGIQGTSLICNRIKEQVPTDGLFLDRSPGTLVKALADPFAQVVSPFKGGTAQNPSPRSNLPSLLSIAHESCHHEVQVQNSALKPGAQCLVPARKFQAKEPVLIADDLLWCTGSGKTDANGLGVQVLVRHKGKTTLKARAILTDGILPSRLHFLDAAATQNVDMESKAMQHLQFLEMQVTFPRPYAPPCLTFHASADLEPFCGELACRVYQVDSQESQQGGVLMLQSADDAEPDSSASKPCATQEEGMKRDLNSGGASDPPPKRLRMSQPPEQQQAVDGGRDIEDLISNLPSDAEGAKQVKMMWGSIGSEPEAEEQGRMGKDERCEREDKPRKRAKNGKRDRKAKAGKNEGKGADDEDDEEAEAKPPQLFEFKLGDDAKIHATQLTRKKKIKAKTVVCFFPGGSLVQKEPGAVRFSTAKSTKVCVIERGDAEPGPVKTLEKVEGGTDLATSWWKPDKDHAVKFHTLSKDPAVAMAWVLQKDDKGHKLGGGLFYLKKAAQIPRGQQYVVIEAKDDKEEEDEDLDEMEDGDDKDVS